MDKIKLFARISSGAVKNVDFGDMKTLILAFGFRLSRCEGSHNIFVKAGIPEILNLQEVKGKAKPYQIKQFLRLIDKYGWSLNE